MGIYTSFWQKTLKQIVEKINPTELLDVDFEVPELAQIGERPSTGFNGRLFAWAGSVETRTDSAVLRNLEEVIESNTQFKNKVPGLLKLRVYANSVLKVKYFPITFELLIERYTDIPKERKEKEKKWQLIKRFQDVWLSYDLGNIPFKEFYQQISFGNLVYPTVITIFGQIMNEKPKDFEKLLVALYDESKDLKARINDYTAGFTDLYYSLIKHGKNTFQEERTIATLLTFRYPEKYTFFKDSFYSKLSKGFGIKPHQKGEKIFHYYSLINDFVTNHLQKHPDIIEEKNNRLDESCYKDQNNLILAQDILFLTLDAKESQDDNDDENLQEPELSTKDTAMKSPLNQIFYGPPGTGKTYHTINKSVAIANPQFDITKSDREQLKAEYERLVKDGQIEFITFHQSMSYEDFIEGIKPMEPKEEDDFLKYEIKDGIFKRLCEKASKVPEAKSIRFSLSEDDFRKASFYKMSLGDTSNPDDDQIYDWCISNGYIALGRGDANDFAGLKESDIQQMVPGKLEKFSAQALNYFIHYAKVGDYVIVSYGNLQFRAVGKITDNYEYKNISGLQVHQFRKVNWLWTGAELPYEEIYDRQFSQQSIYKMDKRGIKKEFLVKGGDNLKIRDNKPKNYVLIIDEINRGNVSQIFGELITLIEEDKRAGKDEALMVTLPYSKKIFSVPSNLYIIGTMNTADRSVEALDTALRRRFSFQFMPPNEKLVPEVVGSIEPRRIFNVINERISYLFDQDHQIGHSYFMDIKEEKHIKEVFKNKIIPLLKEYFYNDFGKIRLILGDSFVSKKENHLPEFAVKDNMELSRDIFNIREINDEFSIAEALKKTIGEE